MSENVSVLVPKRGRPTDWEAKNCCLLFLGDGSSPGTANMDLCVPGDTDRGNWGDDDWYVAFQIADPQKLKLVQYRAIHKESITIWLPEGQQFLISGYWEKTGQVREVEA